MQTDSIRCITIVHPAGEIKEYRWLSAFFRLVGIWVCENVDKEHGDETDYLICIRYDGDVESDWQHISCRAKGESERSFLKSEQMYTEKYWLSVLLDQMAPCFGRYTLKELKAVAQCYADFQLMRGSYAIGYFGDADKPRIFKYMLESRERFQNACHALIEQEAEDSSKYMLAAICNCQRRFNELDTIVWKAIQTGKFEEGREENLLPLGKESLVPYQDINVRISKILEIDPRNFAAYAIRGFVKELDNERILESVYDFENAVTLCGKASYASSLLYYIGRHFETIRPDKEYRESYYRYAYEVNRYNFRAIYKVAMIHKSRKEYDKELDLLTEILDILTPKQDLATLQPVECAYLYKANCLIGRRCISRKKYEKAIFYLERAKKCGRSNKNLEFYKWMFGEEDGVVFKEAAVEKLNLYNCYMDLSDAYAMINSYEGMVGAYN